MYLTHFFYSFFFFFVILWNELNNYTKIESGEQQGGFFPRVDYRIRYADDTVDGRYRRKTERDIKESLKGRRKDYSMKTMYGCQQKGQVNV